jgi:uncharacterized protein with HEPN domain
MRLSKEIILLKHMLDAANEAMEFARNRQREHLDTDRQLLHSLVRCLEIVGEAASKMPQHLRIKYNRIPWENIIGMRNRLIHAYFDVNSDIVWKTVQSELPELHSEITRILTKSD